MKNQLKSKAFLSVRNVIIALVVVFLTAGAVTAIVVSKMAVTANRKLLQAKRRVFPKA